VKRKHVLLLYLSFISQDGERAVVRSDLERISGLMGSSKSRFRSYLSDLAKEGMIAYSDDSIVMSPIGVNRAKTLSDELDDSWLDADEYSLPAGMRFGSLKGRFLDNWEWLMITSVLLGGEVKDLPQVISIMDHVRIHDRKVNLENELIRIENELPVKPITECLKDSSLIGVGDIINILSEETSNVLMVANLLRKQGKIALAENMYSWILERGDLSKNQFILCRVGQAQIKRASSNERQAIRIVEGLSS
jgi:hypothetical protein